MSKFDDDWRIEKILDAAKQGVSIAGCARAGGIGESTLHDWLNKETEEHVEFSERFQRARSEGERRLVEDVADRRPDWLLATSYDYTKTEAKEISGPDGGPINISHDDLKDMSEEELEVLRKLQNEYSD